MSARTCHRVLLVLVLFVTPLSTAWADTATGLVAHWKLDDATGLAATDSAGGNDGKLQGDAVWAEGFLGGAVQLDGNGDYIDCGNKPAFNITDAVTLAAWVQARGDFTYPDWSGIIMRGGVNIDTFALYYNGTSQQLGFKTTGTTPPWFATGANTTTALFDGDWHHVAATYDGTTKVVYLDGVSVASVASTGKIETSAGRLLLGAGRDTSPPTLYLAGRIDEARLYSRGLSAADIKELVPPKVQARKPDPANGATGIQVPLFAWTAGDTAVFHNVYMGTSPDLGPADLAGTQVPVAMFWYLPGLEPGVTYYWRVDEIEADGTTVHTGNVWSFTAQALTAYLPSPPDGTVDTPAASILTWQPGQAAARHHVYFGDSLDAVQQRATGADKGVVADATFVPGNLDAATTYYWAVDEVLADGNTRAGTVWSFSTYLPVEDFESYTDDEGSRIYETWIDGWTNGTGSTVGYIQAPFAEQTVVHGGSQSMPLDYNNVSAPFYSEADREFASAQDWTAGDLTTLVLSVRGKLGNAPAGLYIVLQDTSNRTAAVAYPDSAVVEATTWIDWRVPLSNFSGLSAARIKRITIGLGDRAHPAPGGTGLIYVDDVRVTQ